MRKAFLVGVSKYDCPNKFPNLNSPCSDVQEFNNILENIDFKVFTQININYDQFKIFLSKISELTQNGDEVIVYYSGHGYHSNGHNFLTSTNSQSLPKSINDSFPDISKAIDVNDLMESIKHNIDGVNILILDSCRNVLNSKQMDRFKETSMLSNMYCLFAATIGSYAYDGNSNGLSILMQAISNTFFRVGQTFEELVGCIINYVQDNNNVMIPVSLRTSEKQYCLIPYSFNNVYIMKKNFTELSELYIEVKKLLVTDSRLDANSIYDIVKKIIYLPESTLKNHIEMSINGVKSGLEFIYLLLEMKNINRCRCTSDTIFIEFSTSQSCRIKNENLYDFDVCLQSIRQFEKLEENSIQSYCYKDKTILVCISKYASPHFIQIIGKGNDYNLSSFIDQPIQKISVHDMTLPIYDIINQVMADKKNIAVAGGYDILKEEFIGCLTSYFEPLDIIVNLYGDKQVIINNGNEYRKINHILEVLKYGDSEYFALVESIQKASRIIYMHNLYPGSNDLICKLLSVNTAAQFIISQIICEEYLEQYLKCFNEKRKLPSDVQLVLEKVEVIISMTKVSTIGSMVKKIYVKHGVKFIMDVSVDIDYEKVCALNK